MAPFWSLITILCVISNVNSIQRDQKHVERSNYQDLSPSPSHQPASIWPTMGESTHPAASQASRVGTLRLANSNQQQSQTSSAMSGGYPRESWSSHTRLATTEEHQPELHPFQTRIKQPIRSHVAPPYQQQAAYYSNLPSNLELALRQASGDESVFQPSPTIGVANSGHSQQFDWLTQAPSPARLTATSRAPTLPSSTSRLPTATVVANQGRTTSTTPTITTTSTIATTASTEINNSVMVSNQVEPILVLNHQNSFHAGHVHQKEYETNANNTEFSNQVIYEGPATVPPPPPPSQHSTIADGSDYYFSAKSGGGSSSSSGEGNNLNYNHELANSNVWWAIGTGEEFERASNLTSENYLEYCDKSPLLVNHKQRALCKSHPRVMPVVARAIKMAIDECQLRFAHSRWNCSIIVQHSNGGGGNQHELVSNSLSGVGTSSPRQIFGDVMRHPNRERSFLNAIMAAALARAMTKACSQGELPEECSCDRKIKSRTNNKGRIEWVACSDDIDYGARFSRDFTDNFDVNELDTTMTIYMHNSEVGRRVFKSATDITCTCLDGGEGGGFCQTKRCWKHLGSFADVVDEIIKRYESATHVQRSNKDPHKLRPVRRGVRKPKRKDLVYIDESPDYCRQDQRIGVLGTQNRACNSTSQGPDSCSLLCCGRGFQTVVSHMEEECNCKFVWCCEVKCDKCRRFVTNDICN